MNIISATVAEHWLCPIFNNDETGLTDEEQSMYDSWCAAHPNVWWIPTDDEPSWMIDDITGLWANCVTIEGQQT